MKYYKLYRNLSLYMSVLRYVLKFRKSLHLKNPRDLNEKILWLAFNAETEEWARLADKIKVHEYVERCGLQEMLTPILQKWDDASKIDFHTLPESFVMKTNHGCGDVIIVRDKHRIDLEALRKQMDCHMKRKFGLWTGEPHYLKIKPYIFAEKILNNDSTVSTSLIDYKFFCFYGKPECVLVCYDRHGLTAQKTVYDMDWNRRDEYTHLTEISVIKDIPRPKSLEQMRSACMKLGTPFPFVRIDFYECNGQPVFGEMTFTPAAGRTVAITQDFLNYLAV